MRLFTLNRRFIFATTIAAFITVSPVACSREPNDEKFITCGSAIKISNVVKKGTSHYLNSSQQSYGGGSGQQVVTWIPNKSTYGTLWQVKQADGVDPCVPGTPIACNSAIRLEHLETGKNLHSHQHRSILSGQQEVSGFGESGKGDEGDNWWVECGAKYWRRATNFRLMHPQTDKFLGASANIKFDERNCGGNCPILNHLESFARVKKDEHTILKVDLGVHLYKE